MQVQRLVEIERKAAKERQVPIDRCARADNFGPLRLMFNHTVASKVGRKFFLLFNPKRADT